ncbi:MAG: glucosamine-6-phosphate deaminase [Lachnospiraceae bacterium]|nr:glucosamine-6-phosphate deaminase [Lachnospiraceae bacterium]
MTIYAAKDYLDLSRKAANIISAQITLKRNSVLGLATGSTPVETYRQLIEKYRQGDLDFSEIRTINLDEYKGLSGEHNQSYRYFMNDVLFSHINIDLKNTNIPDGLEEDSEKECSRYNQVIRSMGGIDLQLLGIGGNGHIGFNEPSSFFEKETHLVALAEHTRKSNARFFTSVDEVPTHAYTMGIKNIMDAGKVLLLASGEAKAITLYDSFFGFVTPEIPASILQLHPNCIVIADEPALAVIREKTGWEGAVYDN